LIPIFALHSFTGIIMNTRYRALLWAITMLIIALAASAQPLSLAGRWENGKCLDVVFQSDTLVFAGSGRTVECRDARTAELLSSFMLEDQVEELALSGNHLAVSLENGDCHVLLIANPLAMSHAFSIPMVDYEYYRGLAATDEHILLGRGNVLSIWSITPLPHLVSQYTLTGDTRRIEAHGNIVAVVVWDNPNDNLELVGILAPAFPQYRGLIAGLSRDAIAIENGLLACSTGSLELYDVSSHNLPPVWQATISPDNPGSVHMQGGKLVLGDWDTIEVYSLANPLAPLLQASTNMPAVIRGKGVKLQGSRVAGAWEDHLYFYEAGAGQLNQVASALYMDVFGPRQTSLSGNLASVSQGFAGLTLLNVVDPMNLQVLGRLDHGSGGEMQGALIESGNGLWSLQDPTSPNLLWEYSDYKGPLAYVRDLTLDGNRLVAYDDDYPGDSLIVFDLSSPANPQVEGRIHINPLYSRFRSIDLSGDRLIVLAEDELQIHDLSDLSNPAGTHVWLPPADVTLLKGAFIRGDRLVVWDAVSVFIMDLSGQGISAVHRLMIPSNCDAAAHSGNLLLVGTSEGVEVYDITDPALAQLLQTGVVPGGVECLAYDSNLVIAVGKFGATLLEWNQIPTNLHLRITEDSPHLAQLSWFHQPGAQAYRIESRNTMIDPWITAATVQAEGWTDPLPIAAGDKRLYRVISLY
jgi:hypothetical protein